MIGGMDQVLNKLKVELSSFKFIYEHGYLSDRGSGYMSALQRSIGLLESEMSKPCPSASQPVDISTLDTFVGLIKASLERVEVSKQSSVYGGKVPAATLNDILTEAQREIGFALDFVKRRKEIGL